MKRFFAVLLVVGFSLLGYSVVLAQSSAALHAIAGAPYSAVAEERHTQTLADGTHIDLIRAVTKQFRDAQGRTRMEHYSAREGATSPTPNLIEIVDPVAGVRYVLNPTALTAQAFSLSRGAAPMIASSGDLGAPVTVTGPTISTADGARPDITHESLGADSILGVAVNGMRTTMVYPVGARGNDQPLTIVIEAWRSNELRIDMQRKQDDPRTGVVEWYVTQIDRAEPDASLFQVPPEYQVTEVPARQ